MGTSVQISSEECESILRQFANSEYIKISIPCEADSQQFEVEYKIHGAVRQEDGVVVLQRGHKVSISIPFGFPNFSPNCKPLTPTFHPDFDQDAICINDFWQESTPLADLIVHIGTMIAGREFGQENTFNPEAAAWYKDNPDKIPFDTVDLYATKVDAEKTRSSADLSEESPEIEECEAAEGYEDLADQYEVDLSTAKKKKVFLIGALLVISLLLAIGYFVTMDLQNYTKSAQEWQNSATLLRDKKFRKLESNGKEILARLDRIRFINKKGRDLLSREIMMQLSSEEVKAGLAGKILFEGRYLHKKTVEAIFSVRKFMEDGNASFQEGKWHEASVLYKKAKDLLKLHEEIEKKYSETVDLSFAKAELNFHFQDGKRLFAEKNIDAAVTSFQKAAEIANDSKVATEKISQIHAALDRALLEKFVVEGEGAFSAAELDKALESFNNALRLSEKDSVTEPEYAEKIRQSIVQVKLYTFLLEGKAAYEAGSWQKALEAFQGALHFLSNSTLAPAEKRVNEFAIRKKILQIKIKGIEVLVVRSKVKRDFIKALSLENVIVKEINASSLKEESEFVEKLREAKVEIGTLGTIIDREEKIDYLTENYQKIFHDNHLLARSATLSSPYISFVEENNNIQVFNLKCSGLTATGKISLEMFYQYDRRKKTWRMGKLRH